MASAGAGTASAFSIDTFTEKLSKGGALGSLFQCNLVTAKGTGSTLTDFKFLCKGATMPASTVDVATVTYMGRAINLPGNRAAAQLTTSVYNDEGMEIRNHIENWMEMLNSHRSNKREQNSVEINSYTGSLSVEQLRKAGTGVTKKYEFIQAWPASTSDIAVSWETNTIETFDIVWNFAYWRAKDSSGKVIAGMD